MRSAGRFIHALRGRLIAAVPAVLIAWAYIASPDLQYSSLDRYFYDAILSISPPIAQEARIVIVDIDERSLASEGPWPWPRATVARLVNELTERQEVAMLGLDIVFPESRAGDSTLRAALDHPKVVMSQIFDFAPVSDNRVGKLVSSITMAALQTPPTASGYIANDPGVIPPQASIGHISPLIDEDGQVRRLYPVACAHQTCSGSLALRMYLQLMAVESRLPRAEYTANAKYLRIEAASAGTLQLPLDRHRAWLVPYRVAPGGFAAYSAAEILHADRVLPDLQNTIVLIGSSALGIGDKVATPLSAVAPGVEVHAQLLSALLDERFIEPVAASSGIFLALAAAIVLSWLVWPRSERYGLISWSITALILLTVGLAWMLRHQGLWLPLPALPLMVIAIATFNLLIENFALSARMRRVATRIGQFLPSMLVERLQQSSVLGPETELRTMTVLIVDIRGFTAASEGKSPEQIAEFAQKHFEILSAEVARYQGTIERYSGDGLVALWGAPGTASETADKVPLLVQPAVQTHDAMDVAHAPYAAQAVSAAIAMQRVVAQVAEWSIERQYGEPQLCIGLNTGPMSVGVFGGLTHLTWSAQGQAFNIASRIESLTREVGESILLGEHTARLIDPPHVRWVGAYAVKGVSEPVSVYALKQAPG